MITNTKVDESSLKRYSRLGGLLYLIIIIGGFSSQFFFRGRMIVANNATATANNIMASPTLWRIGIALEYFCVICTVVLAMIYFFLLRPVHKKLNFLATLFRIVSIILQVVALFGLVQALFPLDQSGYLNVFTAGQLNAITSLAIKSHSYGYGISLLFLGCCFLIHGYLIFKSGFLPKVLGILIQIAGVGYLANGFTLILVPKLTSWTFPIIILPVLIAETSLSIWLLVKGVDVEKWKLKQPESF